MAPQDNGLFLDVIIIGFSKVIDKVSQPGHLQEPAIFGAKVAVQ